MSTTNESITGLTVQLTGIDGNAFSIIGACTRVLRRNNQQDQVEEFMAEATSGDYDHVIQTAFKWFEVD